MRAGPRRGLSLLEVMVAMVITGVALALCVTVADQAGRMTRDLVRRSREGREAHARKLLLLEVVGAARASSDTLPVFAGMPRVARFETLCPSPRGWREPCTAELRIADDSLEGTLVLRMPGTRDVTAALPGAERMIYLASPFEGGVWMDQWNANPRPPLGLGIVSTVFGRVDTLLLRIGHRG
jgi:prepilin-type N-terminal cleavage/methylation domain-containing protein